MAHDGGMVDIGDKNVTRRTARASGKVILTEKAFLLAESGASAKGDIFGTAKIAATQAAKFAAYLVPMCHMLMIESVDADFALDDVEKSVTATVTVRSTGKTGVEMEAMTAASVACLTIYDMLKHAGKDMVIREVKLIEKSGGKSGDFERKD